MTSEVRGTDRCQIRIVSIYSTSWRYGGVASEDLSRKLELSGLQRHYELYKDQLPRLLPFEFLGGPLRPGDIRLAEEVDGVTMTEVDAMLFALPSNQVVLTVTLGFANPVLTGSDPSSVRPITEVLEQSINGKLRIRGADLTQYVGQLTDQVSKAQAADLTREERAADRTGDSTGEVLLPERHQLVFVSRCHPDEPVPSPSVVDEIVYRDSAPYREEFAHQKTPEQLNQVRRPEGRGTNGQSWLNLWRPESVPDAIPITLGVVTSYVSLLYGHQRYVEDSIFLSTVHAVGTASRFRQIWHEAYQQVRQFRDSKQQQEPGQQVRADLEDLADNLGNLEFDLTFSVEFPLMRIETFQTALYEAMDLSNQANALSQMFTQLGGSLRSEITAIDVRERRRDEGRQKWNAFAASVLSVIGVSVGFVIAFLGINTVEVPEERKISMWDAHFANLYLLAGLFALTPTFLILFPYLRDWAVRRKDHWALWLGLMVTAAGAALFVATVLVDYVGPVSMIIVDAVLRALAILALLVGLSLIVLWRWRRIVTATRTLVARLRRAPSPTAPLPAWVGMHQSGRGDLSERHEEILRSELDNAE